MAESFAESLLLEVLAKAIGSLLLIRKRTMQDVLLRTHIAETHRGMLALMLNHDGKGARKWQLERIRSYHRLFIARLYEGAAE